MLIFDEYLFDRVPTIQIYKTKYYKTEKSLEADIPNHVPDDQEVEDIVEDEEIVKEEKTEEATVMEYPGTLS